MTFSSRLRWPLLCNLCLTFLLSIFSSFALAQTPSFFSASVPVSSQSAKERERAAAEGLKEVLVRLSGVSQLDDYPAVTELLTKANRYIEQFHYDVVRNDGVAQEHVVMAFSPAGLEGALRQAGLPYWPVNRPSTLVWLVEDDITEGKRLINDTGNPVVQSLLQAAQKRGLPLRFPLLDLDDQLAISAEQVWNLDETAVLEASFRYATETVLVGRYTRTFSGDWWTTWQFFHKEQGQLYELNDPDMSVIGARALAPLADYLAQLYALRSGSAQEAGQIYVQVGPVADFGTYRKTLDYLNRLAVVTSFNLLAVTGDTLLLSLQLSGTQDQLLSALSLDRKLRPRSAPHMTASGEQPLQLEWIGR
ncbi:MAG: DUF2066 domain-containing protein [Cellvibrionaceae bacterium]|nr:DUF2066 domain-containing protein [Cellvibrionaceae bacterium]